jgi:anti-sigma factor RsiW
MTGRAGPARPSTLERDLTRFADGTLEPKRRELLERLLAQSPELRRRLHEQRRAVLAMRWVAERERAPLGVRIRHRALKTRPRPRRPIARRLVLGLAGPAAALALLLALLGGGQGSLTVARAATLAARPALAAVAEPPDHSVALPQLRRAGLPFPYWEDRFGWRATGVRTDHIGGRTATTVF